MADGINLPKKPKIATPSSLPKQKEKSLSESVAGRKMFTEWADPIESRKEYEDFGLVSLLEPGHVIIQNAEGTVFTVGSSALEVPSLTIVSPLGKGKITTNSLSTTISDGQAVYVEGVDFPIRANVTKDLTVGSLATQSDRRTDSLFIGVRIGSEFYIRGQSAQPGPAATSEIIIPVDDFIDDPSTPPTALATYTSGNGSVEYRNFSGAAANYLRYLWKVPSNIDASSGIKFKVNGVVASTGIVAQGFVFKAAGYGVGDGDSISGSLGTSQYVSKTGTYSVGDIFITGFSSSITLANLAADEMAVLHVWRDPADAKDTYTGLVGMSSVVIQYTTG